MKALLHNEQVTKVIQRQLASLVTAGEACRLFHGRGKKHLGLEHISIDLFNETVLITAYKELSDEDKLELKTMIQAIENLTAKNILLQKRYLRNEEVETIFGEVPSEEYALEANERYKIDLSKPQNIGFFLDMKVGRDWLRKHSQNKKVLNLFSYTCSLSVAALKGGADDVVNVDMSKAALSIGRLNHSLNNLPGNNVRYLGHDIMKSLGNLANKGPYDLVIIDPPTNQGNSFKVERDYSKILKRLDAMTSDDAQLLACLNSPHIESSYLKELMEEFAPNFKLQEIMYSSFESQESDKEAGLKILIYQKN